MASLSSPSFTAPKTATFDQSLTNLLDTFKDVTSNKDKSIRVYQNPKSTTGDFITKLHTGISFFGAGARARAEHREAGVQVVTNAIKKEFGCSDEVAKALISHVRNGSTDRVSLRNLREIAAVGQDFVDKAHGRIEDTLKCFQTQGINKIAESQVCTKDDLVFLKDVPMVKTMLDRVKQGDRQAITQMKKLASELGNSTAVENHLGSDVYKKHDKTLTSFKKALTSAMDEAYSSYASVENSKPSVVTFKDTSGTNMYDSQELENFQKLGIKDLQNDQNTWKISDTGANCAMIVKGNDIPYGGAIVKTEPKENAEVIGDISNYIDTVRSNLPNGLPIEGMVVQPLAVKQSELTGVFSMVSEKEKTASNDDQGFRISSFKDKLNSLDKGDTVMMKAMFLENSSDIDKLPLGTKVKLFESKSFPNSLGQAMVLGSLFGMGDHVGLKHSDNRAYTNLSNLMIKNDTGKLVFIDYGPCTDPHTGKSVRSSKTLINDFGAVVDLAKQVVKDSTDIEGTCLNGALASVLDNVMNAAPEGALFHTTESSVVNSFSNEVRTQFALNTLIGALDALLLVAENPKAFESGKPMFEDPGDVTKFVASMKTEMQALKQQLTELQTS